MATEGILRRWTNWRPAWMSLFTFTTKKHVPILTLAMASALIASFTTPIFSVLLGEMFNLFTLFGGGKMNGSELMNKMTTYTVGVAGLGAAGWLFNGSYFILFVTFSELQVANARNSVFEALLKKSQEWFETQPDGTRVFLSSLQDQLHELQMATSQPLGLVVQYSFRTLVSLALAFYTSWSLSLITLAGIPVFSAIISFLSSKMKPSIEAQQKELASMSRTVNIATGSIDTVKCLNGQDFELRNFTHGMDTAAQHYLRQARLNSFQIATIRLMMFSMFVLGFWYGSTLATSGQLSAGEVVRTFWACLTAAQSIEMVLPQVLVLEKGKVAASAMKMVIDDPAEERQDTKELIYPRFCEGDIEVSNLSFAYPNTDILSLNSVDFFFPAGETTFVIGKSGSGKSTLGQLLAHFYLPTAGEIRIDRVPMQTLSVDWIRNNVTIVEQRSVLFSESIFMNIAFGRRDYDQISKGDVQECIELAMLQSTIDNLPSGIDTCVGNGGSFLSGGQRQRVAIARARLRDSPILVLDEPTSALDGANRVEVMKAIRRWRKGKTTIIITHDMSQIQDHDFVYILEQGSIAQAGYGQELKNDPRSAPLFASVDKEKRSELTNGADKETYGASGSCDDVYLSDSSSIGSMDDENWRYSEISKTIAGGSYLWGSRPSTRDRRRSSYRHRRSSVRADSRSLRSSFSPAMYELDTLGNDGTRPQSPRHTASRLPAQAQPTTPKRRKRRFRYSRKSKAKKPQDTASLRQIMNTIIPSLTRKQRLALLFGCISTLVHSSATPVFSYCLSQLQVSFYKPGQSATKWALAVLGVAICDGTVSYFMHYLLELCGQTWVDSLRQSAFRRIVDQPRAWFEDERNSPSQLSTSLGQDGEELRNLVGRFGGFVLVAVSIAIMAVIWSLVVCWNLTLVALACGPVIYAITRGFESTSGLWERRSNDASRGVSEIFVETFAEIRTVRTLTLEPFFHKKYIKAAAKCLSVGLRRAGYVGILFGLVECTIILVSGLIFYYGAVLVSSSRFAVEDIMTVFSMLLFSIGYASSVLGWIPQISTSRDMGARLLRLASLPEGASHEHLGVLGVARTAPVKISRLNFRYPSRPEAPVLRDVSITIPKDSCTAIVGRSGSGKSTIASLMLALYESPEATDGGPPVLSLGGVDIRRLHTPTLRSLISVVSQQPTIFPGTITSNICYGLEETSSLRAQHNVRAAATAAGIDDFIMSLPNGYSTVVGDGAVGLSGGQAQRVVISRALIRRPQILILDEATSALDPASAEVIRRTVRELVSARLGLTVIIITHAKEMMDIADNVVVLEQGRVVEKGPYEVLANRAGGKLRALIEDGGEDISDV